jgi:SAM-dependent methyltransferase
MLNQKDKGSAERFGYEWSNYSRIIPDYETQFLKWVYPLEKKDFKGKKILDAGCGTGRNSFWPLIYGAKELTAFDYNPKTVGVAKKNLSRFENCRVLYNSIYALDYQDEFDISFSIGVIHHLEHPKEAIKSLVRATKPNGIVLIWVYGYEGNEWIVRYINPIRKITSRLPVKLTHLLAYFFSIPLYFYVRAFKQNNNYLKQLSKFRFWHIQCIVLDQLIPKIANYWKKQEALNLFGSQGLTNINIFRVNDNSWTVIGQKKK